MIIEYNDNQIFELIKIDMESEVLLFKTNDPMNKICNNDFILTLEVSDYTHNNHWTGFEVPFNCVSDLNNIPLLLDNYLKLYDGLYED